MPHPKTRRLSSQYLKYGSIRVERDGRVRFSPWTLPGFRDLDCLVVPWHLTLDDRTKYDPANSSVDIRLCCQSLILLAMHRYRVQSACFNYTLTPDALREAVSLLRRVGNGVEGWIIPGLEWNQGSASVKQGHPDTHRIIPELLESVRDLPIAEPWKRRRRAIQRHWEDAIRKRPKAATEAPALWVLERINPLKAKAKRRGSR